MSDVDGLTIGVPTEAFSGERRVALVPSHVSLLQKQGLKVLVEENAGAAAGFLDSGYLASDARIVARDELFATADILLQVRTAGADPENFTGDVPRLRDGQTIIATAEPLAAAQPLQQFAEKQVHLFALELLPRITRAQSMDVLSSMATVAGYKAVLLAAEALPRMFPMLMTAAGTVKPARVFVIGAGVAGLQAIATAKRLGAVVHAYDVRPVVKEQVESVGGRFVELKLDAEEAEGQGGYAREMDQAFLTKQRELMKKVVAENDVVITTAAIPGKKAPILVTTDMVEGMQPGSVIIDLAAERGGNCELTKAGEAVIVDGVAIRGPVNLPATVPYHASEMYSKNIVNFLQNLLEDGRPNLDKEDEIVRETLVVRSGEIVNPRVRTALGLAELEPPPEPEAAATEAATDNTRGNSETYSLRATEQTPTEETGDRTPPPAGENP